MKSLIFLSIIFLLPFESMADDSISDVEIKSAIIQESISSFKDSCPCPFSIQSNGKRCQSTSTYSKSGGQVPVCYPKDVTPQVVGEYRKKNGL